MNRRDLLALAGGSVLGALFSPLPWKLLDDSAIWTQNWSLIPLLPRGPQTFRYTACSLCPGGCSLKARCINGYPVTLTGVRSHPLSMGTLCPVGLAGHHLAFHPLRLKSPARFEEKSQDSVLTRATYEDVVRTLAAEVASVQASPGGGTIVVLDQRPGRALSRYYAEFLSAFPGSVYAIPPAREEGTADLVAASIGRPGQPYGVDLEHAEVVLSFGVSLLDGWGSPGRLHAWNRSRKESGCRLIQVEPVRSRTASRADTWLAAMPGTEAVLALGIGYVLLNEGLVPTEVTRTIRDMDQYREAVAPFHPHVAAEITSVPAGEIVQTARLLAKKRSVVLTGPDPAGGSYDRLTEVAVAGLNILVGSAGRTGGIVARRGIVETAAATLTPASFADLPDHSIAFLLLDAAQSGYTIPPSLIRRKMVADGGTVVQLSPYLSALSCCADYFIPAPAHFEMTEEAGTPVDVAVATVSLTGALLPAHSHAVDPARFIADLAAAAAISGFRSMTSATLLRERMEAVYTAGRGTIWSPAEETTSPVASLAGPDALQEALESGGVWLDDPSPECAPTEATLLAGLPSTRFTALLRDSRSSGQLVLMPAGWRSTTASGTVAPVLSKIFQESDLRRTRDRAALNPETARHAGLSDGDTVRLTTPCGSRDMTLVLDQTLMPGLVSATVGPAPNNADTPLLPTGDGVLGLSAVREDGTWRFTEVTIAKA